MAKIKLKNKQELDAILTYDEVMEYRRSILRKNFDSSRYIKEIELYMDTRFKDVYFERLDRWRNSLNKKEGEKSTLEAYRIIFMIGDGSNEEVYNLYMNLHKTELGEMQYII